MLTFSSSSMTYVLSSPERVAGGKVLMRGMQTTFQTEIGQLIDLITAPEDHVDLSKFSLAKYVFSLFRLSLSC